MPVLKKVAPVVAPFAGNPNALRPSPALMPPQVTPLVDPSAVPVLDPAPLPATIQAMAPLGSAPGSTTPALAPAPPREAVGFERDSNMASPDQIASAAGAQDGPQQVMSPRVVTTPAGWDKSRNPARPENLAEIDAARKLGLEGLAKEQDAGQREAMNASAAALERGEALKKYGEDQVAQAEKRRENEAIRHAESIQREKEVDDLAEEVRTAKIDPDRFWADKDAGFRVMSAIGGALGGFLSVSTGSGRNSFAEHIDKLIERDLAAQREQLDSKKFALGQKRNMLGEMRARFGDERTAEDAARLAQTEQLKVQLDRMAAEADSVAVRDRAQKASAQLDQKSAEIRANIAKERIQLNDMPEYRPASSVVVGGGGGGFSGKDAEDLNKRYVPAMGGVAPTAEAAQTLNEQHGLISRFQEITREARVIREKMGTVGRVGSSAVSPVYTTDDRAKLQALETEAGMLLRRAEKVRGFSDQVFAHMTSIVPNFTRPGSSADIALQAADQQLGKQWDSMARSAGVQKVQRGYALDKNGRVVPVVSYAGQDVGPRPAMPGSFKPNK